VIFMFKKTSIFTLINDMKKHFLIKYFAFINY
jgi:hypothetical protein